MSGPKYELLSIIMEGKKRRKRRVGRRRISSLRHLRDGSDRIPTVSSGGHQNSHPTSDSR